MPLIRRCTTCLHCVIDDTPEEPQQRMLRIAQGTQDKPTYLCTQAPPIVSVGFMGNGMMVKITGHPTVDENTVSCAQYRAVGATQLVTS